MEKMIVEIFVVQGSKILLGFENILLLEQFHSIYVISADKKWSKFSCVRQCLVQTMAFGRRMAPLASPTFRR